MDLRAYDPAALRIMVITLCSLAVLGLAYTADAGDPGYGNPLDLPGATHAADPSAIRVGDTYYVYPTANWVSIECWSSVDLENWTYEGEVWEPGEPGSWNDNAVAPDVLPYEGRYYMYYAASANIGVAVADEPTGPFIDVYDEPFIGGFYTIDPHVFQDEDGSLYMYCTCAAPFSSVRVSPMTDPVTVTGEWEILLRPGIFDWEGFLCEGPWMVKHEGTYYLMYSGNAATVAFYAIGYATAEDPMGPFTKYSGNPILDVDLAHEFYGPGHNSVARGEDGAMWMFYHTKTEPGFGWDRRVRINEVAFNPEGNLYVVLNDDDDDQADDDDDNDDYDDDNDDDDNDDDDVAGDDDDDDAGCFG